MWTLKLDLKKRAYKRGDFVLRSFCIWVCVWERSFKIVCAIQFIPISRFCWYKSMVKMCHFSISNWLFTIWSNNHKQSAPQVILFVIVAKTVSPSSLCVRRVVCSVLKIGRQQTSNRNVFQMLINHLRSTIQLMSITRFTVARFRTNAIQTLSSVWCITIKSKCTFAKSHSLVSRINGTGKRWHQLLLRVQKKSGHKYTYPIRLQRKNE